MGSLRQNKFLVISVKSSPPCQWAEQHATSIHFQRQLFAEKQTKQNKNLLLNMWHLRRRYLTNDATMIKIYYLGVILIYLSPVHFGPHFKKPQWISKSFIRLYALPKCDSERPDCWIFHSHLNPNNYKLNWNHDLH